MNVAVCISGEAREGYQECISRFKEIFPYDFFYMHWENDKKPDIQNCFLFKEPNNHYHCMISTQYKPKDCPRFTKLTKPKTGLLFKRLELFKKSKNWYKQLIAHQLLLNSIDGKYDLIIKLRYDVLINVSEHVKKFFRKMEKLSYDKDIVIGFAEKKDLVLNNQLDIHKLYDCNKCYGYTVLDHIIIHHRYKFKNALNLYNKKNLLGAEWGAHQILCHQWDQQFSFLNIRGGCLLYRNYVN